MKVFVLFEKCIEDNKYNDVLGVFNTFDTAKNTLFNSIKEIENEIGYNLKTEIVDNNTVSVEGLPLGVVNFIIIEEEIL